MWQTTCLVDHLPGISTGVELLGGQSGHGGTEHPGTDRVSRRSVAPVVHVGSPFRRIIPPLPVAAILAAFHFHQGQRGLSLRWPRVPSFKTKKGHGTTFLRYATTSILKRNNARSSRSPGLSHFH